MSSNINAVVSGSFKFKPEIDDAIEALEQTGVEVLEPTKGWLIIPPTEVVERLNDGQIRPLPTEENLTTRQIEDRFLRALRKANVLYLMNLEGYLGNSASLELGFAIALQKTIFALEPLNFDSMEVFDLSVRRELEREIIIAPPESVFHLYHENLV